VTPINDHGPNEARLVFLSLAVLLVAAPLMVVGLLRLADCLGPNLGDIVSFSASDEPSVSTASITVKPFNYYGTCVLDVPVMQTTGGSLVIEAALFGSEQAFQVHWAGLRTDNGQEDCGTSADFLLNKTQMAVLIAAAGGKGVKATQSQAKRPAGSIKR
jgi:hypothetical protein